MTFKVFSTRKVVEDLNIEVADNQSADNVINVLAASGNSDIEYFYEEVKVEAPEAVGEAEVSIEEGEENVQEENSSEEDSE